MLTEKEWEIAHLVAQTHNNMEIATELGISINTVKFRLRIIYQKTKTKNREELKKFIDNFC